MKWWRFILSADRKREEEETGIQRERKRSRVADEAWEKTISQMRAQTERQPLTTSCLGVTAQPHLSVCVPRWTRPKGQWLPAQPRVCVVCFRVYTHTHTAADLCAHALVSLPMFACVPVRTSCPLSVSKLALSLRQIRWVNNCPGLPVSDMVADKCYSLLPSPNVFRYQAQSTGTNIQASPRLQLQPQACEWKPTTGHYHYLSIWLSVKSGLPMLPWLWATYISWADTFRLTA